MINKYLYFIGFLLLANPAFGDQENNTKHTKRKKTDTLGKEHSRKRIKRNEHVIKQKDDEEENSVMNEDDDEAVATNNNPGINQDNKSSTKEDRDEAVVINNQSVSNQNVPQLNSASNQAEEPMYAVPIKPTTKKTFSNNELPEKFQTALHHSKPYSELDSAMKCIIDHLYPNQSNFARLFNYTKPNRVLPDRLFPNDPCIIIEYQFSAQSCYYSFQWKKKNYSKATAREKGIANCYKTTKNPSLQFLYPYKSAPDEDPWAIKIDNKTHALIWLPIERKTSPNNPSAPYLRLTLEEQQYPQAYPIDLLIDESNNILAKRINQNVIFISRN